MKKTVKFPALVVDEATKLKKLITDEERDNLSIERFDPELPFRCIYGLLTYNCFSPRAAELIEKCAKRVYIAEDGLPPKECKKLNGKPKPGGRTSTETQYWSPIEKFIQTASEETNIHLINFLKDKHNNLNENL